MRMITSIKYYALGLLTSILLILLDQYTKYMAVVHLKGTGGIDIIDGVFKLYYLENRGAAFGMMQNKQNFFLITTSIVLLLLTYAYGRIPFEKKFLPMRIIAVLIFSGAIGNMIDRASLNYVVDFLYFELIDFPIFNVADIYVTVSTIIFILLILFFYKDTDLEQIKLLPFKNNNKHSEE